MLSISLCIAAAAAILSLGVGGPSARPATSQPAAELGARVQVGSITEPAIQESSGVVASRRHDAVLWTHNDSGHPAELFAIDREGRLLARYPVAGRNTDWEDIAIDDAGQLYIADIGNNSRKRGEIQVLVLPEPDPASAAPAEPLRPERVLRLRYPGGGAFDAEALFVHDGSGYLISKQLDGAQPGLFSFDLVNEKPIQTLKPAGELPLRTPVTAADVSADGRWLTVMTVTGPSLFQIDGDLTTISKPTTSRFYLDPVAEAITVISEGVLVTNESGAVIVFEWEHSR